ncbi:stress responsive A/B barrel domain-containing protein [Sporodiniella umbellata]|nr:stress responsive A/B barrel domain-containing protein [Sporodiniella umbellata]
MSKIVHIVFVKFKPEVAEGVRNQVVQAARDLKDSIPQILTATAGKNFTDRGKGYEHGWVIELGSKQELSTYADHPAHLDFLKNYKPLFADVIAFDYEA